MDGGEELQLFSNVCLTKRNRQLQIDAKNLHDWYVIWLQNNTGVFKGPCFANAKNSDCGRYGLCLQVKYLKCILLHR